MADQASHQKKKAPVYESRAIAKRWIEQWRSSSLFTPDLDSPKKPFYNLMMFPYPSAEGMHVGNMYAFTGADVFGRFQRMQGYEVFEPIGLDGFGIHSENYAIKIGKHPAKQAEISEKRFYEQLLQIGNGFSWENRVQTYDPEYYKWTQWLFIQMYKNGLAYKGVSKVNWCPSCKTVLSDEQVEAGECERCGSSVERKEAEQWFFQITKYADRLLQNLDTIDWPDKITMAQRRWIGKKDGAVVSFQISGDKNTSNSTIPCFTTRLDTIYGVSFLVVSPEVAKTLLAHTPPEQKESVTRFIETALNKTEQQRKIEERSKTGINLGFTVDHPMTNQPIPVFAAEYVLEGYGTGAVMGVPAHDERDHAFALENSLPIIQVVEPVQSENPSEVQSDESELFTEYGVLCESAEFSGKTSEEAAELILDQLKKSGLAEKKTEYHLRDWLISRQRYWGPPIPMVRCSAECGWQPVPEDQLPVLLPEITDYLPTGDGKSPLGRAGEDWLNTSCPSCGGAATRETDVSDTFLDSSWYFLRYLSYGSKTENTHPFDADRVKNWMPVNAYIGGAEHAVLHLLYSRFVTIALKDLGLLDFEEPFPFLFGHGLIIKDGKKMSKSKGNIVNPDEYIEKYGADTLRLYLMFLGPYDQGGDFRDAGIAGMYRWVQRVWRLFFSSVEFSKEYKTSAELTRRLHQTVQKCTQDLPVFKYNTAIASMMEFTNSWTSGGMISSSDAEDFLRVLAPLAPFLAEEIAHTVFEYPEDRSIHLAEWPSFDPELLKSTTVDIIIQINGKLRGMVSVDTSSAQDRSILESAAVEWVRTNSPQYLKDIEGSKKRVVIPGKLVNFVL